jgi:hypothetical protein
MAQAAADSSSLATWLRQFNPSAPAESLQDSLASNPHLSLSLQRLQESTVRSAEQQKAQQFDLQHAQQKVSTLSFLFLYILFSFNITPPRTER